MGMGDGGREERKELGTVCGVVGENKNKKFLEINFTINITHLINQIIFIIRRKSYKKSHFLVNILPL